MPMFVIIRTGSGKRYARRIGQELKKLNRNNVWIMPSVSYFPESFRQRPRLNPENTIIHSRAAYPDSHWMSNLVSKEIEGFRVINTTDVLKLTSHKLNCSLSLIDSTIPHPKTWEFIRGQTNAEEFLSSIQNEITDIEGRLIIKPYTSMEQGEYVKVCHIQQQNNTCTCPHCGHTHSSNRITMDASSFIEAINSQPSNKIVVQEYVRYNAIYRVIVIGGRALPFSFVDKPTTNRWKVSVCLNRQMKFISHPNPVLLDLAERTQREIGGEINFIDIFSTIHNTFTISEINTACNLSIHEGKARAAGHRGWNIAKEIAKYLNNTAREVLNV